MNTKQAAIVSFLSRAARGETEMSPHIINEFAENCKQALNKQFNEKKTDFRLRMSNIGKPLCQLQMQALGAQEAAPSYDFKMRMAMGDVLEALIIAVIQASGIEIKNKHGKVKLPLNKKSSIEGEFDIELDDGIYDIKTASPFAFENKFKPDDAYERIKESDAFGYVTQGHGYGMASDKPFKGWIALNKSTGEITIAEAKDTKQEREDVYDKIQHTYKSISKRKAFRRCFTDVEEVFYKKPTGNRTLGIECSYCPYKTRCWKNLEFKRQLPSKGRNPKWIWYTHITEEWRNTDDSV